jgi:hypothetical protein
MQTPDYKDLDEVPEPVAKTTAAAARDAAHLAGVLRAAKYPAISDVRFPWRFPHNGVG